MRAVGSLRPAWCRCMQGGPKHGPYYARYWWQDGRRYKRYVRQQDAEQVAAACSARRAAERDAASTSRSRSTSVARAFAR